MPLAVPAPKSDRLAEFIRRLTIAPSAADHDTALNLISSTLNAVEDELSGVPFDPARSLFDGRLYPPSEDYESESQIAGTRCYRQRGHATFISPSGALRIARRDGTVVFNKAGADGQEIGS